MSADTFDLKRLEITAETRAWLQAEATRTGQSQQKIARDALHSIAMDHVHAAKVLLALLRSDGHEPDSAGRSAAAPDAAGHSAPTRGSRR